MAEFVQQRIEDRIPELEQLERVGLFTRKEIRSVVKKVTALEYKIKRRSVAKEDFINYVQYEINFLELLKRRRVRIGYFFKKEEIDYTIVQRIHELFSRATNKWKEDLQLWMSHVAFCRKWNCSSQLSKTFSALLAVHPDKPALWIMAAKWEMEDQLSSESARHLFLRALRFHPESPKVYEEYFRMELMNAEKQRKEKDELEQAKMDIGEAEYSEDILNGQLARVVYKTAVQKIKGARFHLNLLSIAKLFDFTQDLQKEILDDLKVLHAQDPLTWDFMARQELEAKSPSSSEYASKKAKALDLECKEERCSNVYKNSLTLVQTEAMWDLYITFCLERFKRKTNSKELQHKRQERLFTAFKAAHEANMLPEQKYTEWISQLVTLGQAEPAMDISIAATERYSGSVALWILRLEVLISRESADVGPVFDEAFKHVKAQGSLPLWNLMVEWSEKRENSSDKTESLFQKAILVQNPAVSTAMKEKYLDWAYRTKGYKKAKKVFTSLHENRPFSEEFFLKMIEIEKEQEHCNVQNLREYYERALREFGATHPDLWLDYIKEELSHSEGKPENCGTLHWRAMKMLQGDNVEEFVNKYTLLQAGHL
ncbi:U3 small nucleolar RNA-associated 6 homolog [Pelobates cultripes]|uniref:U3 small nucleolar RNA-associated 6 homolog n=1 Tax=Pelobates cultripes TaxID=61616 RepID=A0AAD1S375_PELCU|nr:U3 small nucleolar RNA-associated 6 homolog [Pelobates cultripes]CAH2291856.1 U3 small nucleolar RNA-associated 6 homolog [Pelobates cultripes]CAH2291857.1 U3 small nucleolar RNA-associated 6 homolog [Pelobates cultripes]CAH2291858.1 U3 small nucleolar RNA-associated 6 homolog [Pelobates cultripes]CAH2291859.1 U3 small nucleolar RNA-associated 6 homolog [Pelobates cultripes]